MDKTPASQDNMPAKLSPEDAHIVNLYLINGLDTRKTAKQLGIERHEVVEIIAQKPVAQYVSHVIAETNLSKFDAICETFESIIEAKLEEMQEAEITSRKDIVEILEKYGKILESKAKLVQQREKENTVVNQRNTQINNYGDGNYGELMKKLLENK